MKFKSRSETLEGRRGFGSVTGLQQALRMRKGNRMLKYMKKWSVFAAMFSMLLAGAVLAGCRGGLGWDDRTSHSLDQHGQSSHALSH